MRRPALLLAFVLAAGCGRNNAAGPPAPVAPSAAAAPAGPMVADPAYANWSRFPVGTAVTRRTQSAIGESRLAVTDVYTLAELTPEACVVEKKTTVERKSPEASDTRAEPALPLKFTRSYPAPAGMTPEDFQRPSLKATEVGRESLEVLGKSYECAKWTWVESTEAGPTQVTLWLSDAVPGRVVKQMQKQKSGAVVAEELVAIK